MLDEMKKMEKKVVWKKDKERGELKLRPKTRSGEAATDQQSRGLLTNSWHRPQPSLIHNYIHVQMRATMQW